MDIRNIEGVGQVIRIMPELEELEITCHCETETTRQLLLDLTVDPHSQNPCLCSKLHTVRLHASDKFDIPILLGFVKSRWHVHVSSQCVPLRSITIEMEGGFDSMAHTIFLDELQVFESEGF
ncbi:hypothetical protein PILCRDRAFT_817252, partial [Piloderma croceum F 1598]